MGRVLNGSYRIIGSIAEGGVGHVFEGEQLRLGRRVAIKMLRAGCQDPELLLRFRREADTVAKLAHPHIVQVFDVDETPEGDLFLVMELLEGETLRDRLEREAPLPLLTAVGIASQAAAALASAHEHDLVHRDLKPENIFLQRVAGDSDFVKLLDFGISRQVRAAQKRITTQDMALGTPAYMAPEQARADIDVDARADQFALAVTVYEMLLGAPPFGGATPRETMQNIVGSEPLHLHDVAPWVPHRVETVVHRGLAKDRARRYPTISQFAWALENAVAHAGVSRPSSPGMYSARPPREDAVRKQHASAPPLSSSVGPAADRLAKARAAWSERDLDEAVRQLEKLFEIAVFGQDPQAHELLRGTMPFCRQVFAARVGEREGRLELAPPGRDPRRLNLSPKAAELLALAEGGTTVRQLLEQCRAPEHDALRMIAGLLRRGALVRLPRNERHVRS